MSPNVFGLSLLTVLTVDCRELHLVGGILCKNPSKQGTVANMGSTRINQPSRGYKHGIYQADQPTNQPASQPTHPPTHLSPVLLPPVTGRTMAQPRRRPRPGFNSAQLSFGVGLRHGAPRKKLKAVWVKRRRAWSLEFRLHCPQLTLWFCAAECFATFLLFVFNPCIHPNTQPLCHLISLSPKPGRKPPSKRAPVLQVVSVASMALSMADLEDRALWKSWP